jgi:hypothetical protein
MYKDMVTFIKWYIWINLYTIHLYMAGTDWQIINLLEKTGEPHLTGQYTSTTREIYKHLRNKATQHY